MADFSEIKLGVFRGVPFRYREVGRNVDKALEVIQYVGGPYFDVRENSQGPDSIRLSIVFVGPLAATERALWRKVAERPGSGVLIHPELGIMTAYLRTAAYSAAGPVRDYEQVECEFIPVKELPQTEIAYAASVNAAAITLQAVATLRYAEVTVAPADSGAAAALSTESALASTALASLVDLVSEVRGPDMQGALAAAAVAEPDDMTTAWADVARLIDTRDAAVEAVTVTLERWQAAIDSQAVDYQRGVNASALYEFAGAAFAGRLANMTINQTWTVYDEAAGAAADVYDTLRSALLLCAGNAVAREMMKLSGLTYTGLLVDSLKLPRRTTWQNRSLSSSVELASRLYGDLSRAAELEADNPDIVHPGFVGDMELRVLTE